MRQDDARLAKIAELLRARLDRLTSQRYGLARLAEVTARYRSKLLLLLATTTSTSTTRKEHTPTDNSGNGRGADDDNDDIFKRLTVQFAFSSLGSVSPVFYDALTAAACGRSSSTRLLAAGSTSASSSAAAAAAAETNHGGLHLVYPSLRQIMVRWH